MDAVIFVVSSEQASSMICDQDLGFVHTLGGPMHPAVLVKPSDPHQLQYRLQVHAHFFSTVIRTLQAPGDAAFTYKEQRTVT